MEAPQPELLAAELRHCLPQVAAPGPGLLPADVPFVSPPFSLPSMPAVGGWELPLPPLDLSALSRQPRSRRTRCVLLRRAVPFRAVPCYAVPFCACRAVPFRVLDIGATARRAFLEGQL